MRTFYHVFSLIVFTCFTAGSQAQLSEGGTPYSFGSQEKSASELSYIKLPAIDRDKLLIEDQANDVSFRKPWRFGKDIYVNYNTQNSGTWERLNNGGRLWRLGIVSKDALSLSFTFSKYKLPAGAKLFLYNSSQTKILGAFTSKNNQEHGFFATSLLLDDTVIIEYYEPADAEFPGDINLWRVTHGYRSLINHYKAFGESGACNVNAACPEGEVISDQIRSVAVLLIGGNACTGSLINNTNKDGTPYFLTADHCFGTPGASVFWFNWQSKSCQNPSSPPSYNVLSGATSRARFIDTDFWLLELNDQPPDSFEVFYTGWNRTTTAALSGMTYSIHHPNADIKKISWSDGGVEKDYLLGDPDEIGDGNDFWRVSSWSDGTTTEAGSSGSALFDKNKRIIGQLSAGGAACGNLASDWFGRIGESWIGGGTNDSRLSNWLDPFLSGVTTLDGFEPSLGKYPIDGRMFGIIEPFDSYLDTIAIIPRVIIQNYGSDTLNQAEIQCIFNLDSVLTYNWNGELLSGNKDTIQLDSVSLSFGKHNFIAKIIVAGDTIPKNDSLEKNFTIVDCGGNSLPVSQGFNSPSAFFCWTKTIVNGEDVDLSIVEKGTLPACNPSEGTHMLEFNSWSAQSGFIRLNSQAISTEGIDSVTISFDWHHDPSYPTAEDKIIVQYSLDRKKWINAKEFIRANDSISGWDRKNVILPNIVSNNHVVHFGLLFVSGWGSNCHLDSLIISGKQILEPYADFIAEPLTGYVDSLITFSDISLNGPFSSWIWDFGDGAFPSTGEGQGPHDVSYPTTGIRTISLTVDDTLSRVKENYITINEGFFPPRNLSATLIDNNSVYLLWDPQTLFTDGFESGDFSKWDTLIKGEGTPGEVGKRAYWHVGDEYSFDGNYGAITNWGSDIDTRIVSPPLSISNDQIIQFNWVSSYFYNVLDKNGDLIVEISSNGGVNWAPIWQFSELEEWIEWEWYVTALDLSIYDGLELQFAFHIVADTNADIALDNVYIGDGSVKRSFGTSQVTESYEMNSFGRTYPYTNKLFKKTGESSKAAILSSYSLFRNDIEIAQTSFNFFTDHKVPEGLYEYYVITTYSEPDGISGPSNIAQIEIIADRIKSRFENTLSVYPNPGNGIFNVRVDQTYTLKVTNIEGQLIQKLIITPSINKIDLSDQVPGLYILQFISDRESIIQKVIIE